VGSYLLYIPLFFPTMDMSPYPAVVDYMIRLVERPGCPAAYRDGMKGERPPCSLAPWGGVQERPQLGSPADLPAHPPARLAGGLCRLAGAGQAWKDQARPPRCVLPAVGIMQKSKAKPGGGLLSSLFKS
jgi:hypothetical protein